MFYFVWLEPLSLKPPFFVGLVFYMHVYSFFFFIKSHYFCPKKIYDVDATWVCSSISASLVKLFSSNQFALFLSVQQNFLFCIKMYNQQCEITSLFSYSNERDTSHKELITSSADKTLKKIC